MAYQLEDLLRLMAQLRDPRYGCPWDQKQDLASIVPHTLDEVYEVIDTIERNDYPHLQDELGDLLFQVVFYAQICAEQQQFQFTDIIDGLVAKLLRRHPHVYPDGSFSSFGSEVRLSEAQIKSNWERIKAEERAAKARETPQSPVSASILDDLSGAMPALMRAHKLQKRAASVGFDWRQIEPVLDNLDAEMLELRQALAGGDSAEIADELGDLLFSCVNLVRHLQQDSEQLLRQSNHKFEQRFRRVEQLAAAQGLVMADSDDASLDRLWQQAKRELQQSREELQLSPPQECVDTLGLVCPLPLMRLQQRMQQLPSGTEICLLADDPATLDDIPDWCLQTGHSLLSIDDADPESIKIRVRKSNIDNV